MRAVSIISSRNLCVGRHICRICAYLLWLAYICTVFLCLIYLLWSVCTSFIIFHVPLNFHIGSVQFWIIFNEMIFRSTSEAPIWFPTLPLITLIIRVTWIKGWFIIVFLLLLFLKHFSVGCEPQQWLYLDWANFSLSIILTEWSKPK